MEEEKYIIDHSQLEHCDVILTADATAAGKGIRLATLGKYSHAAIFVGGTAVEATLKGVFSKNPQRMLFDKEHQVAVFRSKTELTRKQVESICTYAQSQTGTLYALPEVFAIRALSALGVQETRKQFCSRLVAKAFEVAGYNLAGISDPAYCTPRQLAKCKSFRQIQGIVRRATDAEIAFASTPDPNMEHMEHTYGWLNKVRDLVKCESAVAGVDVQSINDVGDFLLKYPQYDRTVSAFVEDSGYLDFYEFEKTVNPHRYNARMFQFVMLNQPDPLAFIESELDKEPDLFFRYAQNLEGYLQLARKLRLRFFLLHIQLYVNLIKAIYARMEILSAGYALAGEADVARDLTGLNSIVLKAIQTGEAELSIGCEDTSS